MSQDGRSPSPTKSYAVQSPVSPGGSSGFSSRRSSQDGFHLEDLSPVQQQLSEINHRYGLLGVRLTDRQTELDNIKEEVKRHLEHLKILSQFLDKVSLFFSTKKYSLLLICAVQYRRVFLSDTTAVAQGEYASHQRRRG